MKYEIPIDNKNYYKAMLMIMTCNLRLTKLELTILTTLLENDIYIVDIDARDLIRKELNYSKFVTNNYIKQLKDKGVLTEKPNDKKLYLDPNIVSALKDKEVSFKFIVE